MTKLALTGDSIVQRRLISRSDPQILPLFDLIRSCDVAFTNLEVLPNDYKGDPALESGGSHFGAPSWVLDELVDAGFNLFATATNHSLDYSISGLEYALEQLNRRSLSHAGCGVNLDEARRPAYVTTPHATVGMVSCASTFAKGQEASRQTHAMQGRPGLSPLHPESIFEVEQSDFEIVKKLAVGLGLEKRREFLIRLGFEFDAPEGIFPFNGMKFRQAAKTKHVRRPNQKDLDDILRWVAEMKLVSDIAIVSLHAHEQGDTKEDPADFIIDFARAVIDGGADIVAGHGPHLMRGIEMYKGKPIFYSMGNFVGQNEMVQSLPGDSYDRFRVSDQLTPGALYKQRTSDDRLGFPSDIRYWQTFIPICQFDGGNLTSIEIHPISLGLGEPRHRRGRPRLASGEEGHRILNHLQDLSGVFGSKIRIDGQVGRIDVRKDGNSKVLVA